MTRQFIRECRLTVGKGDSAEDLSNMRITFEVKQFTTQAPNNATIRVYNLAKEHASRIQKDVTAGVKGGTIVPVVLDAGYDENCNTIFRGEAIYARTGRENPTDTYLDLFCRDGDMGYNHGVINRTLKAGSTHRDHVDAFLDALKEHGITEGSITGLGDTKYPRPYVFFGMVREHLRRLALTINATWSIQNGKLDIVPNESGGKNTNAFVLNANTGLIGMPVETLDGIMVTALINPQFFVNGQVKIDEKSIQRGAFSYNWTADIQNSLLQTLGTSDGVYRILAIDWVGDTRGGPWYAYLTCIGAMTGSIPNSQTQQGRGGE